MDLARKYLAPSHDDAPRSRPRADLPTGINGLEKVLRLATPARDGAADLVPQRLAGLTARDVGDALELIHRAAQDIRAAEERARDGESRTQTLLQRATEELKNAEARVQAAEARCKAAEARAEDSEARAREAEGWLRQIFSTLSEELPAAR